MSCKVSVVIPYYQQEPGILREAVKSAIAQEGVRDLEIIVVDDGSPAPARDDLHGLDLPAHVTLKLIEQPNRGPGAARNRALDNVRPGTVYVAFLDSDDAWTNDHLRSAQHLLNQDYDVYFSDLWFSAHNSSFFSRQGMQVQHHKCLDHLGRWYEFRGNARFDLICSRNFFHTSTVVYRYESFETVRFSEQFFMGEDLAFWMRLLSSTQKLAFSCNFECTAGLGVHIYENRGWNTPKAIWRLHEYIKWRKWLGNALLEDPLEVDENRRQIIKLRRDFAVNVLREIKSAEAFRNADILRFLWTDPIALLHLGPAAGRAIIKKIGS